MTNIVGMMRIMGMTGGQGTSPKMYWRKDEGGA